MPEMTSNWPHSAQILTSDEQIFVFIFLDKMHSKMLNKYRTKTFSHDLKFRNDKDIKWWQIPVNQIVEQMKSSLKFLTRWTRFCNQVILMNQIGIVLILNNHLQCLHTKLKCLQIASNCFFKYKLSCLSWRNRQKDPVLKANFCVLGYE